MDLWNVPAIMMWWENNDKIHFIIIFVIMMMVRLAILFSRQKFVASQSSKIKKGIIRSGDIVVEKK